MSGFNLKQPILKGGYRPWVYKNRFVTIEVCVTIRNLKIISCSADLDFS